MLKTESETRLNTPMSPEAMLQQDLSDALAQGELRLVYQPLIRLSSGKTGRCPPPRPSPGVVILPASLSDRGRDSRGV